MKLITEFLGYIAFVAIMIYLPVYGLPSGLKKTTETKNKEILKEYHEN